MIVILLSQTAELLEFLVQQMEHNISALLQAGDECKQADELEFAVVILQAVTSMFRETEVLDCRAAVLTNKESVLSNLAALIVKYTDPKLLMQKLAKGVKRSEDEEVGMPSMYTVSVVRIKFGS